MKYAANLQWARVLELPYVDDCHLEISNTPSPSPRRDKAQVPACLTDPLGDSRQKASSHLRVGVCAPKEHGEPGKLRGKCTLRLACPACLLTSARVLTRSHDRG